MECHDCLEIFNTVGRAFNSAMDTVELLETAAQAVVDRFALKGCHFRLLSRDRKVLEHVAAYGLSQSFINKGPVDAERSVAEALEGTTVMVADCVHDPRIQYPSEFTSEGITSMLTVPLRSRGQVIGVMRLFTRDRRDFTRQDIGILEVVASFCASAILHSMFHSILGHVTDAIRASTDLDEVLRSIARIITEDLRARGCVIQLCVGADNHLELSAAYGLGDASLQRIAEEPGSIAHRALAGECVAVVDVAAEGGVPHRRELVGEGVSSVLYVPLMSASSPVGVLSVYTRHAYQFSDEELYLMRAIGEQCALAIRNAQMYASMRQRYETVKDDFQQWFEHYCVYPSRHGGSP